MSTSHPPHHPPPPSPPSSLPPSRDFMTSLLNSLTSPTSLSPGQTSNTNTISASSSHPQRFSKENERDNGNGNQNQNQNPFKQTDAQKKALLMTLHVIFPPPLLLHALDLLDRGGVGRVILRDGEGVGEGVGTREDLGERRVGERGGAVKDPICGREEDLERDQKSMEVANTGIGDPAIDAHKPRISLSTSPSPSANRNQPPPHPAPNPASPPKTKPTTLYQVRSSQPPKRHSSRSASASGAGTGYAAAENTYTVHLDAWNCSCAAFAFSAFPAASSSSSSFASDSYPRIFTSTSTSYFPRVLERVPDAEYSIPEVREKEKKEEEEEKWRYGGWTKTSQVPICKHLLACLLVERWGDVLGMYVRERVVGREEMAGLVV
ncbi:hypothetical protein EAE96_001597 [Botrytis aclada]|nr:hypothetical protein EAE96_001597 [Botrytis aclada]